MSLNTTEEGYVAIGWELIGPLQGTSAVELLISASALQASLSSLSPGRLYIRSAYAQYEPE